MGVHRGLPFQPIRPVPNCRLGCFTVFGTLMKRLTTGRLPRLHHQAQHLRIARSAACAGIPAINNISGLGRCSRAALPTRIVNGCTVGDFDDPGVLPERDDATLFVAAQDRQAGPGASASRSSASISTNSRPAPGSAERSHHLPAGRAPFWDKGVREFVEAARLLRARSPTSGSRSSVVEAAGPRSRAGRDLRPWVGRRA